MNSQSKKSVNLLLITIFLSSCLFNSDKNQNNIEIIFKGYDGYLFRSYANREINSTYSNNKSVISDIEGTPAELRIDGVYATGWQGKSFSANVILPGEINPINRYLRVIIDTSLSSIDGSRLLQPDTFTHLLESEFRFNALEQLNVGIPRIRVLDTTKKTCNDSGFLIIYDTLYVRDSSNVFYIHFNGIIDSSTRNRVYFLDSSLSFDSVNYDRLISIKSNYTDTIIVANPTFPCFCGDTVLFQCPCKRVRRTFKPSSEYVIKIDSNVIDIDRNKIKCGYVINLYVSP